MGRSTRAQKRRSTSAGREIRSPITSKLSSIPGLPPNPPRPSSSTVAIPFMAISRATIRRASPSAADNAKKPASYLVHLRKRRTTKRCYVPSSTSKAPISSRAGQPAPWSRGSSAPKSKAEPSPTTPKCHPSLKSVASTSPPKAS